MKEIFINKTKCSKKEYNMFIKAHDKNYGLKEIIFTVIFIIIYIWFIIYSLKNNIYYSAILVTSMLFIFLIYRIVYPNAVIRKEIKSKRIKNEEINTYRFYNHYFKIKNENGKTIIFYFKIHKVLENDTNFYIYLNSSRAFSVSKQGFIKGNSNEFGKFIKKKIWLRYKKDCNKKMEN